MRIGLIPDDWFKAMYDKTGVTGPYILFWGGLATLLSKEYFIYWADTAEQIVFLGLVVFISKKYGKTIGAWLDKEADQANTAITKGLEDQTKGKHKMINTCHFNVIKINFSKILTERSFRTKRCSHYLKQIN